MFLNNKRKKVGFSLLSGARLGIHHNPGDRRALLHRTTPVTAGHYYNTPQNNNPGERRALLHRTTPVTAGHYYNTPQTDGLGGNRTHHLLITALWSFKRNWLSHWAKPHPVVWRHVQIFIRDFVILLWPWWRELERSRSTYRLSANWWKVQQVWWFQNCTLFVRGLFQGILHYYCYFFFIHMWLFLSKILHNFAIAWPFRSKYFNLLSATESVMHLLYLDWILFCFYILFYFITIAIGRRNQCIS